MKIFDKLHYKLLSFFKPHFYQGTRKWDLIIYDNLYPNPKSGFRQVEFDHYLANLNNVKAVTSNKSYRVLHEHYAHQKFHIDNTINNLQLYSKSNVLSSIELNPWQNINTRLFYCIFLNNTWEMLPILEKFEIPFVFTLYPGGGFDLFQKSTNDKLERIFNSKYFRKVIVTQKVTYNYLVDNNYCAAEEILSIFGCPVPESNPLQMRTYSPTKNTLDICFCASKYSKYGEDKGYPSFIEVAKILSKKYEFIRFHVIGGFNESVLNVEELKNKIAFYGYKAYEELKSIFNEVDIIISPNQPNKLKEGAFDGFPLGTLIEAAFNGVLVMSCDYYNENEDERKQQKFIENSEIIIIEPTADSIINKIEELLENPSRIEIIGSMGNKKFREIYSTSHQLTPRIQLIKSFL